MHGSDVTEDSPDFVGGGGDVERTANHGHDRTVLSPVTGESRRRGVGFFLGHEVVFFGVLLVLVADRNPAGAVLVRRHSRRVVLAVTALPERGHLLDRRPV